MKKQETLILHDLLHECFLLTELKKDHESKLTLLIFNILNSIYLTQRTELLTQLILKIILNSKLDALIIDTSKNFRPLLDSFPNIKNDHSP